VFDLASSPQEERKTAYWARFSDIAEVQPTSSPENSK